MLSQVAHEMRSARDNSASFSVRTAGRVVVLIWHTNVTVEGAQALAQAFGELKRLHPNGGFGFLTIAEENVDIRPPAALRQAMAHVLREYGNDIGAAAISYEAAGFKATIVRSVITAINLAGGTRFPNKVFSDTRIATEWLSTQLGDSNVPREVALAVGRMRRVRPLVSGINPIRKT